MGPPVPAAVAGWYGLTLFTITDTWQSLEVALSIDVPYTVSSFPTGSCWPLVGDVILIFVICCWGVEAADDCDGEDDFVWLVADDDGALVWLICANTISKPEEVADASMTQKVSVNTTIRDVILPII